MTVGQGRDPVKARTLTGRRRVPKMPHRKMLDGTLVQSLRRVEGRIRGLVMSRHRYHRGSVLANRLGYQLFRALSKSAAWQLRRRAVSPEMMQHVARLDEDGVVVIPDFLAPEAFERVRAEYLRSLRELPYQPGVVEDNDVAVRYLDIDKAPPEAFTAAREHFQRSPLLLGIAAAAMRRPVSAVPPVTMNIWEKIPASDKTERTPGANYVHADVHYPTVKMFFYLNDIDEENGAIMYARGSHKMTPARLAYEYDASVRVARAKSEGTLYSKVPYGLVRVPTEAQIQDMGIVLESICGKANTLIIANTQGFHKQGQFRNDKPREKLMVDFRDCEASLYNFVRERGFALFGVPAADKS